MVRCSSPDAQPGDIVAVFDKAGERFGSGFWNPRSEIAVRMLRFDGEEAGEPCLRQLLETAVELRHDVLDLPARTNAYRVVHAEGDGLSGLIVDRFDHVLSVQVHSLGIWKRIDFILEVLEGLLRTSELRVNVDGHVGRTEGIPLSRDWERTARRARIEESGLAFEVDFDTGHKTGYFCDQRENRLRLAGLVEGKRVLDVCTYTGGFAVAAGKLGKAAEVTGVDLDEKAIEQARRNANINHAKVRWVHADAFSWARQMAKNGESWDVVVCDPPKFIPSRAEFDEGLKKYYDLNRLALELVRPGGIFVTCSCSGLFSEHDFERMLAGTARRVGRRVQIFEKTGAGADHPVLTNNPESRYLKVIWARALD